MGEVSFEIAEARRELVDQEVNKKHNYKVERAYESWYTYKKDFDLNQILVPGKATFFAKGDKFWGDEEANDFKMDWEDATIVDIMMMFDMSMKATRDFHHCFLEGINSKMIDGVNVIQFSTGS